MNIRENAPRLSETYEFENPGPSNETFWGPGVLRKDVENRA